MNPAIRPALSDEAARARIRGSLSESLMVEASAGTGKTSELVRRMVAILEAGLTSVDKIVAVTFTHKAAGELKLRLRQELDRARSSVTNQASKKNLEDALARLEEASIGTIHSFCAQLLRERPVEARVDPAFEELSEQEAGGLYNRAFRGWMQAMLAEESHGLRRAFVRLAWRDSWDDTPPMEQLKITGKRLIDWRDFPASWSRISYGREAEIDELAARVLDSAERMSQAFRPVHELAQWIQRAEAVRPRDYDTLEALLVKLARDLKKIKRKGAEDLIRQLESFQFSADADLAAALRDEMQGLLDRYDEMKRKSGKLDFLDLLIQARDLVRRDASVRAYLQRRFTHIFVDEFQDTDPLQAELLLLLSSGDANETDWKKVRPAPGKLFVVGDPKQSIYKFRRADVALYESIRVQLLESGVDTLYLSRSFRSVRPIQECVNAAFEDEMQDDGSGGQAKYVALKEHSPAHEGQPAVVVLPAPRPYGQRRVAKSAIDACLPDTVAAYIEWLVNDSGWTVRDTEKDGARVPIEQKHICVLFRRFLNFGADLTRGYARSLEARGIKHLLVGSKSFHDREEVETVRAALAAIEWPADELSVFATLKGSFFAIPDVLLLRYREELKTRLNPFYKKDSAPNADFAPIREALDLLADLHKERNRRPVAETVNLLLEATRAHAGFALRPAGHQVLANIYRICDLARNYEAGGGISFRGFVDSLETQAGKAESAEAPVVEEGADGVRLMTVHSAKGLEFPVVILADVTANLAARDPERHVAPEKGLCAMRLLRCAPVELVQNEGEERTRELAEGVRVAYVAATRARDLLVVPANGDQEMDGWLQPLNKAIFPAMDLRRRAQRAPGCPKFGSATVLERPVEFANEDEGSVQPGLHVPQRGAHGVVWWDPASLNLGVEQGLGLRHEQILGEGSETARGIDEYKAWQAQRSAAIAKGSVPTFQVFTASDAGVAPPAFECSVAIETTARTTGRPTGKRFGTLVHAVLRDVSLDANREQIAGLARLHAILLGATEEESSSAVDAVNSALQHPLFARIRAAETVHREWPIILPLDGAKVLEGTIDLAFLEAGLWHVIDFKTDEDLEARASSYQSQVKWYAYALFKITGQPAQGHLLSV
jgi:ATP-dependent exoDNAse (exonuclease V) beta subunit